jgi:hypothetical protein
MLTLTPPEEGFRAFLITMARAAAAHDLTASPRTLLHAGVTMAYGEMAKELDPDGALGWNDGGHYTRLTHALYHVNTYELEHRRPMVGAFAVSKAYPHTSGSGFAGMARDAGLDAPGDDDPQGQTRFWREQLTASASHWSTHPDGAPQAEVQFDAVMSELAKIRQMLRRLLHGQHQPGPSELRQELDAYLKARRSRVASPAVTADETHIRQFLDWLETGKLSRPTADELAELAQQYMEGTD